MTRTSHVRRPTKSVWDNFFALRKYLRFCEGKNMRKSCRSAEDDEEGAKNEIKLFRKYLMWNNTSHHHQEWPYSRRAIRWMWHLAHKASPMTFEMIITLKVFVWSNKITSDGKEPVTAERNHLGKVVTVHKLKWIKQHNFQLPLISRCQAISMQSSAPPSTRKSIPAQSLGVNKYLKGKTA